MNNIILEVCYLCMHFAHTMVVLLFPRIFVNGPFSVQLNIGKIIIMYMYMYFMRYYVIYKQIVHKVTVNNKFVTKYYYMPPYFDWRDIGFSIARLSVHPALTLYGYKATPLLGMTCHALMM